MEYCKYCGSLLDGNGHFCSKFGKNASGGSKASEKDLISNLMVCTNVFLSHQSKYDQRDRLQVKLAGMK